MKMEIEKYHIQNIGRNDYETGISRDERYLINKQRMKIIDELELKEINVRNSMEWINHDKI